MIKRSSSVISVSTCTHICFIGLHWAIFIPNPFLYNSNIIDFSVFFTISGCQNFSPYHSRMINQPLFCYLKSFYFSTDHNNSFSVSSSSRITMVEPSHHQFVYFLCPPPSQHHFNLRIFFLFLFHMHYLVICMRNVLLFLNFCYRFYQNFTVFHELIIPFFIIS